MTGKARMRETAGLLREIYAIVEKLEALHPGRSFKPDGHLVGAIAWAAVGKKQKNGQRSIRVNKLRTLMELVAVADRLPIINKPMK
jgi:hypothetical protein